MQANIYFIIIIIISHYHYSLHLIKQVIKHNYVYR